LRFLCPVCAHRCCARAERPHRLDVSAVLSLFTSFSSLVEWGFGGRASLLAGAGIPVCARIAAQVLCLRFGACRVFLAA
jgi:hypothetical protein